MYAGFGLFLFIIYISLPERTNQDFLRRHYSRIFRRSRDVPPADDKLLDLSLVSSTLTEPILFFQNEPVPLASSVVDDLTTLASAVYIISLIVIVFVLLVWITHYNAPCSSIITSILSTITGLPEPIIHSVALCGSCCIWCETTWLFRRIHHFNIWTSNKIKQFVSGTCKVLYDTICPCCRPPDTPSNRSIIGSLPASIIGMIHIPDHPGSSPPRPVVTATQPTSVSPNPLTTNINLYPQPTTESLIENQQDYLVTNATPVEKKTSTIQTDETKSTRKKRRRRPRKQAQLKQRSAIGESSNLEEQIDDTNEDDDEEEEEEAEEGEDTKIY